MKILLLLRVPRPNTKTNWHIMCLHRGDSRLFKWKTAFFRGELIGKLNWRIYELFSLRLSYICSDEKPVLSQRWVILYKNITLNTKLWIFLFFFKKKKIRIMILIGLMKIKVFIAINCFSCERCGPWASCLTFLNYWWYI